MTRVRVRSRVRAREGPTLIEAVTYRMGPHNTADDPTRYVDPVELEERRAHDPIARVRRHLAEAGLVDEASEARLVEELRAKFDAVMAEVEAAPKPGPEAMFSEVYAAPPPRVSDQRRRAATPDTRPDRG
jgi:TPP-dependent pyruvate/acetoin dehydrogenase alpha subunit